MSELECFHQLEKLKLLDPVCDQWFSPHKAEHGHYSLRLKAHRKGWPQPPKGTLVK
jgi:hypothetical protein